MGQITLENNTNNALKVDLATLIQGEDVDNNWMKTNAQGYTKSAGASVVLDDLGEATPVACDTIDMQAVSVYNGGPDPVWVAIGEPVYDENEEEVIESAIPVPPGLALTIPAFAAHDNENQVSLILASGTEATVAVMVVGNAVPE